MKPSRILWLLSIGFTLLIIFKTNITLNAQNEYGDFTYTKQTVRERKTVPYPSLREADVMYCRRIERIIDTREKINVIMNWPKSPFSRFIYDAVISGFGSAPINAYRNDSLASIYTAEEVLERGAEEEVIEITPDPEYPDYTYDSTVFSEFRSEDITRYRLIEDWIFDKQSGKFFVRIIAIAPLYRLKVEGQDLGEQTLFYVKYEDLKPILVNQEIFNRENDSKRLTYDDFFELRLFNSYVTKEANAFDYAISEYEEFASDPMAGLLESEKIKNKLFDWEHDLWEF